MVMKMFAKIAFLGMPVLGATLFFAPQARAATTPLFSLSVSPQPPLAGDKVTLEVIPQNFEVASTSFDWFRDEAKLPRDSGLGKSKLTISTDPARTEILQVRVDVDPGGDFSSASQSATIHTVPSPRQQREAVANIASDFSLEASSLNPNPGETVNIAVVTFAFDKDEAMFEWRINGVDLREASGRGRYQIAIPAGAEGESKTVSVTATAPTGMEKTKSLVIKTMSAPLYWWAETNVPYWYKGKALPTMNSRVNFIALPNVRDPGEISYQWELNDSVATRASGVGRQTFALTLTLPVEERISLTMRDAGSGFSKTASFNIKPFLPLAGIYELRPLRGVVFEKRVSAASAPAGEARDFIAESFFFPLARKPDLSYRWSFNNQEITGDFNRPGLFTIRSNRGETSLDNQLDVAVADPAKGAEEASASVRVSFR